MVRTHLASVAFGAGSPGGPGHFKTRGHYLRDIVDLAVCAAISGADDWDEVECFGRSKFPWFRQRLRLQNGVPSRDAFSRVFALLDPERLREDFSLWVARASNFFGERPAGLTQDQFDAIHREHLALNVIDSVSAWVTERGIAFGQNVVHGTSNANAAIPELLRRLELANCVVTLDTVGSQRSIPQQIVNQGADYALIVKASHGRLHQNIQDSFSAMDTGDWRASDGDYAETVERSNGRVEKRRCWSISQDLDLALIQDQRFWPSLRSVAMVKAERHIGVRSSGQQRYYISSLPGDASELVRTVRDCWEIGSSVHWCLEIANRNGSGSLGQVNETQNLALLRELTHAMIKAEGSPGSVKVKRKRAGWDVEFLERVLSSERTGRQPHQDHEFAVEEYEATLRTAG